MTGVLNQLSCQIHQSNVDLSVGIWKQLFLNGGSIQHVPCLISLKDFPPDRWSIPRRSLPLAGWGIRWSQKPTLQYRHKTEEWLTSFDFGIYGWFNRHLIGEHILSENGFLMASSTGAPPALASSRRMASLAAADYSTSFTFSACRRIRGDALNLMMARWLVRCAMWTNHLTTMVDDAAPSYHRLQRPASSTNPLRTSGTLESAVAPEFKPYVHHRVNPRHLRGLIRHAFPRRLIIARSWKPEKVRPVNRHRSERPASRVIPSSHALPASVQRSTSIGGSRNDHTALHDAVRPTFQYWFISSPNELESTFLSAIMTLLKPRCALRALRTDNALWYTHYRHGWQYWAMLLLKICLSWIESVILASWKSMC